MRANRINAVVLRQLYLYKRSWTRILEVFYWPTMDLLLWGFLTIYLQRGSAALPHFVSYFIGALILWDILFRAEQGVSVSFLEDMWSRNLINIFVSPITVYEYLAGLVVIGVIKVAIAFAVMSSLGWLLYSFNVFRLGITLLPLALNLVLMGIAVGVFTTALILRFGLEAEILAWALAFLFLPFSAVFYPVSVLPHWLKVMAWFIPASHVFEGMRQVIAGGPAPVSQILAASGLNLVYIVFSFFFFVAIYRTALARGIIPKIGA